MIHSTPTLRRALGKWDLTAIGINQVIGSAIFLLPSQVAAQVGNWSPIAFLAAGFASLLVALCFAEVGSRFEGTGGPYLYTRAAFGRFVGFEVGWMQWVTRVTSQASIVNAIALALGFYWPAMMSGAGRASIITAVTLALGWINLRGIRLSAFAINLFTVAKLVPLALFIGIGVWFIDFSRLAPSATVSLPQASAAALLLIFAFGGYDIFSFCFLHFDLLQCYPHPPQYLLYLLHPLRTQSVNIKNILFLFADEAAERAYVGV